MYVLTIATTPPLTWAEPDITSVGAEQSAVNGEVPNLTVVVNNALGQYTRALAASNILRLRAELTLNGQSVFVGAVQVATIGSEIVIELEA